MPEHYVTFRNDEQVKALLDGEYDYSVDFYEIEHGDDYVTQYFRTNSPLPIEEQARLKTLPGTVDWAFNNA